MRIEATRGLVQQLRDNPTMSPALVTHFEKAVIDELGGGKIDRRLRQWSLAVAITLWLALTAATGLIAITASLGLHHVDDKYFTPLWGTFGVGFAGMVVTTVKQLWGTKGE